MHLLHQSCPSSTTDITALVLVFPPIDEEDKYRILPYFWIPEETLDLCVRHDHVPYDLWENQRTLMTTSGNVVHYGYIEKLIEQLEMYALSDFLIMVFVMVSEAVT